MTEPADTAANAQPPELSPRSGSGWRAGFVVGVASSLLASAIWSEVAPERGWGKHFLLAVLSLGSVQTKNATYREAARGLHERSSDDILYIVLFFLVLALAIGLRLLSWAVTGKHPKPRQKPIIKSVAKRQVVLAIAAIVFVLLSFGMLWQAQMYSYAHAVAAHFRQSLIIVKPYLNENEVEQFEADFAAMGSADDFVKIDEALHKTAEKNHRQIPQFSVW